MTYTETNLVAAVEQLAGVDLAALTQPQLDGIDQFHSGGAEAVERLLPSLRLTPSMTALDVGSGLGGPARQVARATGCRVVGVDITPAYVDAARALTAASGQSDQVDFLHADVADVERSDFDAAYTMHVQMNVADKQTFFTAIASRLRVGARLGIFEVCRPGQDQPAFPVAWSIDGADSFLVTPSDLRTAIEHSGFETVEWVDETAWVLHWFQEAPARWAAAGSAAALPALLTDGPTRMMNFAGALRAGILSVHRGAFRLGLAAI
jgi:sarcosine/dimethylglycine N-methyltransferase